MILNNSPLDALAAFAIAFFVGILCGMGLFRYAKYIRDDALRVLTPA
ncbi:MULTISPECIES: hypothetical protein [unclassified Polaromonas]|nr:MULTISPECIES: hypothetical protein [unclassified Polaromonas]